MTPPPPSPPSAPSAFYPDLSQEALRVEAVRLARKIVARDPVWKWGLHV